MFVPKNSLYRRYLLAVLMVIYAFNSVDRLALGLVLQDVKVDLRLSDSELGLLTGVAFSFLYAIVGIPIARWADRGNRVSIISLSVAVWSIMVSATGLVANFTQLLLLRIAVGVGEAGCVPPANSIIADYFSRSERPRAAGIYMTGGALSVVVGYFVAGWLNELYGWRFMFAMLGMPGVLLSVLSLVTLTEPRKMPEAQQISGATSNICTASIQSGERATTRMAEASCHRSVAGGMTASTPSVKEVCATLWANATYRQLIICYSVLSFFAQGSWQWQPAYFVRSYGLTTGELGTWFAVTFGVTTLLGLNLGGALASRYAADNESLQFKAMAVACVIYAVTWSGIYLTHNYYVNFVLMGLGALGLSTITGPLIGAIQSLVSVEMRAMAIAILFLFANLIGMGLGPLAVGAASDMLHPHFGPESLRYALLGLCPGYVLGGWYLWRASKTVTKDIKTSQ